MRSPRRTSERLGRFVPSIRTFFASAITRLTTRCGRKLAGVHRRPLSNSKLARIRLTSRDAARSETSATSGTEVRAVRRVTGRHLCDARGNVALYRQLVNARATLSTKLIDLYSHCTFATSVSFPVRLLSLIQYSLVFSLQIGVPITLGCILYIRYK